MFHVKQWYLTRGGDVVQVIDILPTGLHPTDEVTGERGPEMKLLKVRARSYCYVVRDNGRYVHDEELDCDLVDPYELPHYPV